MEAGFKHSPVIHRIQRGMWENKPGILHVLIRLHAGTPIVKTSRQTILVVRVVHLPGLIVIVRLGRWLNIEKRSGMVSSLLPAPK